MNVKVDNNRKNGDKVNYQPVPNYITEKKYGNGIIKELVDDEYVRVVFHCGEDWDNYQNYTGALTPLRDLYQGWKE